MVPSFACWKIACPSGPFYPLKIGWFQHLSLPIGNKGKPSPSINWESFVGQNQFSLGGCKLLSNHENSSSFLFLAAASISAAIPTINLHPLAAASIPAAIDHQTMFLPSKL
ncbi:hypothetical protein Pyn_22462 [Prunus yedoensis var. nudiflora]|uniref:Uncharacterized protein n=1 Tax=Prunus yedoensis var. nudiflora TaxID=2094558 RepID=A0A314Y9Q2_PRUYE|nr:hypothetical protein Pyn_22462 [Prunus yedoensis var. nudiflora]